MPTPRLRKPPVRRLSALAALGTVALLAASCGGSGSDSGRGGSVTTDAADAVTSTVPTAVEAERFDPGDDSFFTIPSPIPTGTHGDLLRVQEVAEHPDGMRWERIMYLSETVSGEPTVVTGVLSVPDGPAPTDGWRLATHGHGSTGLADDCAPSRTVESDPATGAELAVATSGAADHDYLVVSTDYEGQGGPGRHPFVVGVSEGRAVLDAARAARQFPGLELASGDDLAIVGYSQGGHAALWADQIAADWTPEFTVTGTVAGAPASEVSGLIARHDANAVDDPQAVAILGGLVAAHPELAGDLDGILTPGGRAVLDTMDASCTAPDGFTLEPPLFTADPRATEPWKSLLADNTPGSEAANGPVLVIHSAQDESVPVAHSATLVERMCASGSTVERRVLDEGTHVTAAVPTYADGFAWLAGLVSGDPAVSSCGG